MQVMQGRSADPDRARELMASDPTDWRAFRPEILGTLTAAHDGDAWTMAIYFTSEEAARKGEAKKPRPETQQVMERVNALATGVPTFLHLRQPSLFAPA